MTFPKRLLLYLFKERVVLHLCLPEVIGDDMGDNISRLNPILRDDSDVLGVEECP